MKQPIWKIHADVNLYYSEADKTAFMVTGYDSSGTAVELIDRIQRDLELFKQAVGTNEGVYTQVLARSSRYKHMRVYWLSNIETAPKDAFILEAANDWTMWKWLTN